MPTRPCLPRHAQFAGMFLGPGDLPPGMHCIRDGRDARSEPPATEEPGPWVWAGWAHWMAPSDAELYRVDDRRWVFAKPRQARLQYRAARRRAAGCGPPVTAVSSEGFDASAFGQPGTGYTHVLRIGLVVAQVCGSTGEGPELRAETVLELAAHAAMRASRTPPLGGVGQRGPHAH